MLHLQKSGKSLMIINYYQSSNAKSKKVLLKKLMSLIVKELNIRRKNNLMRPSNTITEHWVSTKEWKGRNHSTALTLSTTLVSCIIIKANWTKPSNTITEHWVSKKEWKGRNHSTALSLFIKLVQCILIRVNWTKPSNTITEHWVSTKEWKGRNHSTALSLFIKLV